jgi:hypothetical protein
MMTKIVRTSPLTGRENSMVVDITPDQYEKYLNGELIQIAFPHLTNAEREFILTGYTPQDWEAMFPKEDDQ